MDPRQASVTAHPFTGVLQTFIINDVVLKVPPTNITIQQENLVYEYKTLRSNSSTKVPTGHGMMAVHLICPFVGSEMLALHRLVTEFKNSPFCYIENEFLRANITPADWSDSQNMAFALSGMNISPMKGSSDTWIAEFDFIWFNYFPYTFNWLYREDWVTNYLYKPLKSSPQQDGFIASDIPEYKSYTIGWDIDRTSYERIAKEVTIGHIKDNLARTTIVDTLVSGTPVDSVVPWSNVNDDYINNQSKTIYEMEANAYGETFDLSPMPGNMSPSKFVYQPKDSSIYVRYINYLQRDALLKNFNIDVEEILDDNTKQLVFAKGLDANSIFRTVSLIDVLTNDQRYFVLKNMLSYNGTVRFALDLYQTIELPEEFQKIGNRDFKSSFDDIASKIKVKQTVNQEPYDAENGQDLTYPIFLAKKPVSSGYGMRNHPVHHTPRLHKGVDFPVPEGTPIYAPVDGILVNNFVRYDDGNDGGIRISLQADDGSIWTFMHLSMVASGISLGSRVTQGTQLAATGRTGAVTGPHLHLEYRSYSGAEPSDPLPHLRMIAENYLGSSSLDTSFVLDPVPDVKSMIDKADPGNPQNLAKAQELVEFFDLLAREGWYYYDEDSSLYNVWHKPITFTVNNSGADVLLDNGQSLDAIVDGLIFTGCSGGFRNVLARIPILSHEYPTLQHMASTEPVYNFQFHSLDNSPDEAVNLEGISIQARFLQSMRALLQRNARYYRIVPNSWALSTDTFITRFLGSFEHKDIQLIKTKQGEYIQDVHIDKRTVINSSMAQTVEGNPGLSVIEFQLTETNPFEQEKLEVEASNVQDQEEVYKIILGALDTLNLDQKYKQDFFKLFLIDLTGSLKEDGQYGRIQIQNVDNPLSAASVNLDTVYTDGYNLLINNKSIDSDLLDALGVPYMEQAYDSDNGAYVIPAEEVGIDLDQTYGALRRNVGAETFGGRIDYNHIDLYDYSALLNQYPNLRDLPVQELIDKYRILQAFKLKASLTLVEEEIGGYSITDIKDNLYGISVTPHMWQAWNEFLLDFAYQQDYTTGLATPIGFGNQSYDAEISLKTNINWPSPNGASYNVPLPNDLKVNINEWAYNPYSYISVGTFDLEAPAKLIAEASLASGRIAKGIYAAVTAIDVGMESSQVGWKWGWLKEINNSGINNLIEQYLWNFVDNDQSLMDYIKDSFYGFFGSLTLNSDVLNSVREQLRTNAESSGNIVGKFPTGAPGIYSDTQVRRLNTEGAQYGDVGLPMKYPYDDALEISKLKSYRNELAQLARDIMSNPSMLKLFGLEKLVPDYLAHTTHGREAYPDLVLPAHPYYGDSFDVSPDFYMWNIYEDGGALSVQERQLIYSKASYVVGNAYKSMHQLRTKINSNNYSYPSQENLETNPFTKVDGGVAWAPEGSDKQDYQNVNGTGTVDSGPSSTPFYPNKKAEKIVQDLQSKYDGTDADRLFSSKPKEFMPNGFRLGLNEGSITEGKNINGGIVYPTEIPIEDYEKLKSDFEKTENMFGSRQGFLNQFLDTNNESQVQEALKGTELQQLAALDMTHAYDLESLQQLAKDSGKDIFGWKRTLRRAYPTYKLYIIEEDEEEDRFISLDDFYSYNGIKEFTYVSSRLLAADHAVITLQNVSGILDGSKRNSLADLDYLIRDPNTGKTIAKSKGQDLDIEIENFRTASNADTGVEQYFNSIVLRQGMNVQLRAGYSNNPNSLEVLLSGRVADLQYNQNGDIVEILVQSFGTELMQQLKGAGDDTRQFATTHELLASMMLEPEVKHYGRWEFGAMFQRGEVKDYRFDMRNYKAKGWRGHFGMTNSLINWMLEHPIITAGLAVGSAALAGRVMSGSRGGKLFTWITGNAATGVSEVVLAEEIVAGGGKSLGAVEESLSAARRIAIATGTEIGFWTQYEAYQARILAAVSPVQQATVLADTKAWADAIVFKGQWMRKPITNNAINSIAFWSKDVGLAPLGKLFGTLQPGLRAATGAVAATAAADLAIDTVIRPIYNKTLSKAIRGISAGTATLFLSPQDDNLFPPHPKDYMDLDRSWLSLKTESLLRNLSRFLVRDDTAGSYLYNRLDPKQFITKKVTPSAAIYTLDGNRIWDIFYEMTLRHPGWVHASRPYGNKFEYRMFFGPVSQRYWSKPMPNDFVYRTNTIRNYLDNGFTEQEFEALYGSGIKAEVDKRVEASIAVSGGIEGANTVLLDSELTRQIKEQKRRFYESIALKEYLRALDIRFTPFRRYHAWLSDRDIVANNLMSSNNASYNSIDVRYYPDAELGDEETISESNTLVVKAHSYLPDIKIKPIDYSNCKTPIMAARYGMGELIHSLKDMYRGEILLLGDSRIRPWDTGIIVDTYNDIVGPVEVEQVVHTFSPETGWLTEIKPSAIVIGNEISTWPMVEAMKVFALASVDIENKYKGQGVPSGKRDGGYYDWKALQGNYATSNFSSVFNSGSQNQFLTAMQERYAKLFKGKANPTDLDVLQGQEPEGTVLTTYDTVQQSIKSIEQLVIGVGALTALAGGSYLAAKSQSKYGVILGGASVLASSLVGVNLDAVASSINPFPSVIWLLGGPQLFMRCWRNETVIVVPLLKNGWPIVAGLGISDPKVMWNAFRGELTQYIENTIEGSKDMISLYKRYGTAIWERLDEAEEALWAPVYDPEKLQKIDLTRN